MLGYGFFYASELQIAPTVYNGLREGSVRAQRVNIVERRVGLASFAYAFIF